MVESLLLCTNLFRTNRTPRIMIDLVMVINYCCKEIMRTWSDIDPNWSKWVGVKLGFCWIPHKSTTLPHFRIEDFINHLLALSLSSLLGRAIYSTCKLSGHERYFDLSLSLLGRFLNNEDFAIA